MGSSDDRAKFKAHTRAQSRALGDDNQMFQQSVDTIVMLQKYDYSYLWTWMGVPIIQHPADIIATQEVIWRSRPDVIIETGVARGGSVVFLAAMLEITGSDGFVIGVDIDIRPHNRETIECHRMAHRIHLVSGSSVDCDTVSEVKDMIPESARVMVILDANHAQNHVLKELRHYSPLVTEGCYLVIADTILGHLSEVQAPSGRSQFLFRGNEPLAARDVFLTECDRFEVDDTLNGKLVLSSSPGGYLKCVKELSEAE